MRPGLGKRLASTRAHLPSAPRRTRPSTRGPGLFVRADPGRGPSLRHTGRVTVSWWFFLFAAWCAVFTAISLWPPRRPGFLIPVTFFSAWLTSELTVWHLVWQPIVAIVFVAAGALESWPGWLALALLGVSWAGLAARLVVAGRTDRVFERALADALGPTWRDTIDPAWTPEVSRTQWARTFSGWRYKRRGVVRIRDLQYVDDGLRRHRLDVWRREGVVPSAPVLLQIHGGGWVIGSKDQQARPLMRHLADRGWICVAINYRLSPRATWPEHLVDCKLALRWIREHIAEYGGDPGYVVVTGGSAGGHLAAMVGLTANRPEFQPGFEDVDTTVRAMVPFYGVYDFLDRHGYRGSSSAGFRRFARRSIFKADPERQHDVFESASPLDQIHPDAPPALVIHGDLDVLAPVCEARVFVEQLRAVSHAPVVYVELAGAQHAFEMFNSVRALHSVAAVDAFLDWLLSRDGKSADAAIAASDPSERAVPSLREQ
jgi:acetyl esterase/lipase